KAMAVLTAEALGLEAAEGVLVCSTGVIGVPLPMQEITGGIEAIVPHLEYGRAAAEAAAEAILTTDTFTKEVAVAVEIGGKTVTIGGMAKGSGMIHPDMATMLSFITTDAAIEKEILQALLDESILDSYNMISVDGDTSTNDTVLVLANGASGAEALDPTHPEWHLFKAAFDQVNTELAKLIIRDGEGATKFLEFRVQGAQDTEAARVLARAISSSSLVKAAYFGSDANWGRILCAMGYSGAAFNLESVDLFFESKKGRMQVVSGGEPLAFDNREARNILMEREVTTEVFLGDGAGEAIAWGCDLSYEYVRINGEYRS
ncbi:MAG TPA: bifunctional glutamate N-acetyltransferase/amino-acid acetyltransferase ArgJ, partial [Sphaerochaeta sp.]|nr:bifunctional glutamate N-acetyltransferase/amino-acid acetyltransferase ArgJ [Sphaerochaeta sp.]